VLRTEKKKQRLRNLQRVSIADIANTPATTTTTTTKHCAYLIDNVNSYDPANANRSPNDECHEVSKDSSNEECQKCCSYSANEMILDGHGGGFQVQYAVPLARGEPSQSEAAATCYAFVDALHDTICSPYQGSYIRDNAFRVSQESCDLVYQRCVPTGIVSPGFASNGTAFCRNAWGDPCSKSSNGYPCRAGLAIEVVDDDTGIAIVQPTHVLIVHYEDTSEGYDPWKVSSIVAWSAILVIMLGIACFCFSTSV